MTHVTEWTDDRSASSTPGQEGPEFREFRAARQGGDGPLRAPAASGEGMLGGVVAAALGLGTVTVAVLLLWITTPYPDSGPSGALHVAAGLWLLAHGVELVRADSLTGVSAPVGVTPLLLIALPVWLLYRTSRYTVEAREDRKGTAGQPPAGPTIGWLSAGYLLVGVVAVLYTSGGPLGVDVFSALLHLPVLAMGAAAYGVWVALECPCEPLPPLALRALDRIPDGVRSVLTLPRLTVALPGAGAGTAVLLAGGALLVAVSLAWHGVTSYESLGELTRPWSGRLSVLVLSLTLVPNAVVWGAAYGLGAGFMLGSDTWMAPFGAPAPPDLPYFPLLTAIPGPGPGGPLTWAVLVVPVAAAVALGWFTACAAVRADLGWRDTAAAAAIGGAGCAVAMALLAGVAGGSLGTGALEEFGPAWWLTGAAALFWTTLVGTPAALVLRWWWMRRRERAAEAATEGHAGGPGSWLRGGLAKPGHVWRRVWGSALGQPLSQGWFRLGWLRWPAGVAAGHAAAAASKAAAALSHRAGAILRVRTPWPKRSAEADEPTDGGPECSGEDGGSESPQGDADPQGSGGDVDSGRSGEHVQSECPDGDVTPACSGAAAVAPAEASRTTDGTAE
ncbi:cell division protein PerM [Streptomyces sp. KR80]|uniref:cell division protein PerM n=1 Tax=Streptomyces sp. KR80 TaxID=3457426 RepID=UPI003FCF7FDA